MTYFINPKKFEDYETKDLAYKDQARKLICDHLGYEPPLRISVLSEVILRRALKLHEQGKTSKDSLKQSIEFQGGFIKRLMMERVETYNC